MWKYEQATAITAAEITEEKHGEFKDHDGKEEIDRWRSERAFHTEAFSVNRLNKAMGHKRKGGPGL